MEIMKEIGVVIKFALKENFQIACKHRDSPIDIKICYGLAGESFWNGFFDVRIAEAKRYTLKAKPKRRREVLIKML